MRAFISYSINDKDQYILTLLSSKLRQKNIIVTSGQNFYGTKLDYITENQISKSHLFIGIITRQGIEKKRVFDEWNYAKKRTIPNLILVEESVRLNEKFKGNYIKFNRKDPQPAIEFITKKMTVTRDSETETNDDILPWILGGAALMAIIALLSGSGKK